MSVSSLVRRIAAKRLLALAVLVGALAAAGVATQAATATRSGTSGARVAADTTKPTPAVLSATSGTGQVVLSWTAATDDVGVTRYEVWKDNGWLAGLSATARSYTATGLAAGVSHSFRVVAYDAAGNFANSNTVTAAAGSSGGSDTTKPTAPVLSATPGAGQVALSWTAATDDVGVTRYEVWKDNGWLAGLSATARSYTATGLAAGVSHSFRVVAYDAAGNFANSNTVSAAASGTTPPPTGPCGTATSAPASYDHVVWIVMENEANTSIIGSSSAPYINKLASQCGSASQFYAETHPSLGNYIAMTSGSTQGITDDNGPSSHPLAVPTIFSQLPGNWRALEESMPSNCLLSNSGLYAVRHNPAAYYTNIRTECGTRDVALGSTPDLSARFTFVAPNLCDDMHDCSVATGDTWLSGFLGKVFSSTEYQAGRTAVFLTWDEDDTRSNNHIPTLVAAPSVPPGTVSSATFTHYSMLRTTEELLGLGFVGNASSAASMRSAFKL
ncbi:MAG: phosphatidylinositol-3-phosphatase [Solirubrobacteraceae bacterium]|nr:phosphatidylinositol-3-phosphatase [Solirubrobacteraceae bacterium]